jgi:hypothetical protein
MGSLVAPAPDRWALDGDRGIVWNVAQDSRLPHEDHIEMSGRKVSLIVRYGADASRGLTLSREVIWPMLRTKPNDVRGYLRRTYGSDVAPRIILNGQEWTPGPVSKVRFDGTLIIEHSPSKGLSLIRTLFPSIRDTEVIERWNLRNAGREDAHIEVVPIAKEEREHGVYGEYVIETVLRDAEKKTLEPKAAVSIGLIFRARRAAEKSPSTSLITAERDRRHLVAQVRKSLRLETPDRALDRAFDFAKLRAAESVFDTKMGLVHSPGGGRYYGGVWANDQAEYSGPFFPFLGEPTANEAALNAYRIFARAMKPDYHYLPSSFEVEGDVAWSGARDRGDAAMIAYGASRFALARGNRKIAEELWPAIQWCLEFTKRKTNAAGVVESDSDELEGRFSTGTANLSTSTLAYGALRSAANLGRSLSRDAEAKEYDHRADALRTAIEKYFGANVQGFDTYRYYEGNTVLRSWICLPLVMGIENRKDATVKALFSPRLWTEDGLATQAGDRTFWDRSTLYALRGVLAGGETEIALRYLTAYTKRRLLGDHVPYPVEAYPEGGQAHLSAESALYCRIITEGLFGITPTGLKSFRCLPRLPQGWKQMALRNIKAFGDDFDLVVSRAGAGEIELTVTSGGNIVHKGRYKEGAEAPVTLP